MPSLTIEDSVAGVKQVKRVPMEGISTDAQAVAKLQELLIQRRKSALPVLKRTPLFADYAKQNFDYYEKVNDAKWESTLYTERIIINHWIESHGRWQTATLPNGKWPGGGSSLGAIIGLRLVL